MFLLLQFQRFYKYNFNRMRSKINFYIFLCSLFIMTLPSCLDSDDDNEYVFSSDARITYFTLSSLRVSDLANTDFSIDQMQGIVFNFDSLPYNSYPLASDTAAIKAKLTYTLGAGTSNFLTRVDGDSVWVTSGDTIDLKKVKEFEIYAPDGVHKKKYTLKINVHTIDPDSVQYIQLANNLSFMQSGDNKAIKFNEKYYIYSRVDNQLMLYQSENMKNWERLSLIGISSDILLNTIQVTPKGIFANTEEGKLLYSEDAQNWSVKDLDYKVKTILGYLNSTTSEGLSLIIEKDGSQIFGFIQDVNVVVPEVLYGKQIPADFPLLNFSTVYNTFGNSETISVINGLNSVWATENGLQWIKFGNPNQNYPDIKGGNAFMYDKELYFIGGVMEGQKYNADVYYSINGGLVWDKKESKMHAPANFMLREGASLIVEDNATSFYILGGKRIVVYELILADIWKVTLNSRTFDNIK